MGPLVPSIISSEFDLIIALILGFGFGFILEQAGFSNARKLTGLFYGNDFVVLKVFFTAGVTAMICVLAAGHFGLLDISMIYINPTFLHSAIIGGGIMGAGFIIGGFCPGTSLCASAIGKIDGIIFVLGSFIGIYLFMEIYPLIKDVYLAGDMGAITIFQLLGISNTSFALVLSAIAIGMFVLVSYIEAKVNGKSFEIPRKRVKRLTLIALIPFAAISITGFMPDRSERIEAYINDPKNLKSVDSKTIDADKLAFEITNNYYQWNIIDVRGPAEYKAWHLPLSINIPIDSLLNPEWRPYFDQSHKKNVLYSDNTAITKKAFLLAEISSISDNYILKSSCEQFRAMFFEPKRPGIEARKDAMDIYHFRVKSAKEMVDLAKSLERFHIAPKKVIRRKVQGGCS
jgi:hypothetical protein